MHLYTHEHAHIKEKEMKALVHALIVSPPQNLDRTRIHNMQIESWSFGKRRGLVLQGCDRELWVSEQSIW